MSTGHASRPMLAAACVAVTIEAASNALFAYSLGGVFHADAWGRRVSVDGALLALGSVAIAVFQAQQATVLLHPRQGDSRWLSAALLLVCVAYSVGAMASHILELQRLRADRYAAPAGQYNLALTTRASAQRAYDIQSTTVDRLAGELDRLGEPRPPAVVLSAIAAVRLPAAVAKHSNNCTRALAEDWVAVACADVLKLQAERAAGEARARTVVALEEARGELGRLQRELDAASTVLAGARAPSVPGPVEAAMATWLPWVFAVAVELCGTFGFAAARRGASGLQVPAAPIPTPAPPSPPAPTPTPAKVPRTVRPGSLEDLLRQLADGSATAAQCSVLSDGWIDAPQSALAKVLGVTPATVCRAVSELEAAGAIATRKVGRRAQVRVISA